MRQVDERKPKKNWRTTPVFADITRDACAFLEAACNVRYFEQEQICRMETLTPRLTVKSSTAGRVPIPCR